MFWQEQLLDIFQNISAQERKDVTEQLLLPKSIFWNPESKKFEYRGQDVPFAEWMKTIPENLKTIRILAAKLLESLNMLDNYEQITQVADYLDNIFNQINQVKVNSSMEQQAWKRQLQVEFIYAVAKIVKSKTSWELPQTLRGLNMPVLKTFICEVFLKQQVLGYLFKTLRNKQLVDMPFPIISEYLSQQQRIRQLEVVRASKYLFAIAPTLEYSVNPFTLRRFLNEERLFSNRRIIFNGVAINTALLNQYDASYQEKFTKQIESIITIESNISRVLIDFVQELEDYHENTLIPVLFYQLEAGQVNLSGAISKRLKIYEDLLTQNILMRLRYALLNYAKNSDEFDYLYVAARQLFGAILSVFKDFQSLPSVLMNTEADILFGRLVAYATFLEKRRGDIFVEQSAEDWKTHNETLQAPLNKVIETVEKGIEPYQAYQEAIQKQEAELEKPEGFIGHIFKKREHQIERLNETKKEARQILYGIHKNLMNLPEEFGNQMVYLEFDAQLITDETLRNYAFPAGDNGVSALPIVLTLPEFRLQFNLNAFVEQLQHKTGKIIVENNEDDEE